MTPHHHPLQVWGRGLARKEHWPRWLLFSACTLGAGAAALGGPAARTVSARLVLAASSGLLVGGYLALEVVPEQGVLQVGWFRSEWGRRGRRGFMRIRGWMPPFGDGAWGAFREDGGGAFALRAVYCHFSGDCLVPNHPDRVWYFSHTPPPSPPPPPVGPSGRRVFAGGRFCGAAAAARRARGRRDAAALHRLARRARAHDAAAGAQRQRIRTADPSSMDPYIRSNRYPYTADHPTPPASRPPAPPDSICRCGRSCPCSLLTPFSPSPFPSCRRSCRCPTCHLPCGGSSRTRGWRCGFGGRKARVSGGGGSLVLT